MRNIYKYSFILGLVLLFTSILFLSFKLEDKPSASKTPDEYIASYIEGEYQTAIPGKDDGYVVDKIVCDNGATGTWNNEEWGIDIRNATQKVKCSIYFIKTVKLTDKITTLAATDSTNFATDDPDNNIRYIGKDPNNYVYYNCSDYSNQSDSTCEKWRIIGLFKNMTKEDGAKENLIKIIRNDYLEEVAWDSTRIPEWSVASLQTTLNGDYYNGTYNTGAFKNDLTRNAVESVVWNLGGSNTYNDVTVSMFYERERGTTVTAGNSTTWTGKIGLMYPSDYGYATAGGTTTDRALCITTDMMIWDESEVNDCKDNDYLFKPFQWTLTHVATSKGSHLVFYVDNAGGVFLKDARNAMGVYPSLYLKSSVSITSGAGSSSSPYQLSV